MNLYLFNDNDCASTYGIGTYLKELTEALRKKDMTPNIITPPPSVNFDQFRMAEALA